MIELAFLALGLSAGILSGLFGIGGGIVMVPIMVSLFGLGLLEANAISLAAMLLPVGIMGVVAYYKAGYIQIRESIYLSLGLFVGSFLGGEVAVHLDSSILGKLYAAFLLYVASTYIFSKNKTEEVQQEKKEYSFWAYLLVGALAGIIAGLFGKGGGLVIVPMLVKVFKYSPKMAAATSLAALLLPVGLPSVLVYNAQGYLNIEYAAYIAGGIVIGTLMGTKLALKLPNKVFKQVYAIFLVVVAVYLVFKTWNG